MDIKLGSNAIRNTNGVVTIQGKEQIVLEWNPETHQLLLTMDLYDESGQRVAHLRRNTLVLNQENCFAVAAAPDSPSLFTPLPWLEITQKKSGEMVLEARVMNKETVAIPCGRFYTHKGQLVEISSHYCRVGGGATMFGDVMDARGGPVRLE